MRARALPVVVLAAMFAGACDQVDESLTAPPLTSPDPVAAALTRATPERTPFQRSLMATIAEREAAGLPVPERVTYEYEEAGGGAAGARVYASAPEGAVVTARTAIEFTHPEQAGLSEWPAVVVEGEVPPGAEGYVREGDYTEYVREEIARRRPDSNVEYETGPRTYTFSETLAVTDAGGAVPGSLMDVELTELGSVTAADELLMGFTVLGPNLDYSIGFDVDICVFWWFGCVAEIELIDFWAGYEMDWTVGLRLPVGMDVATTDAVTEGSVFTAGGTATGLDWAASDFDRVGVAPMDGNEYSLHFVFRVGVFLEVLYVDVIDLGIDEEVDSEASFATPLGPGATFTLPSFDLSIWGLDIGVAEADVGVALTPSLGSDRLTGDWTASAEGSGSGSVTFTESGAAVPVGGITALDGPGVAALQLSGLRYYFTQFQLDLGLYFYLSVLGYGSRWDLPITDFDLGGVTGGLFAPPHAGTPAALQLSVPIENVAPTVALARAGAVDMNGVPTFLAEPGETLTFHGEASDPGRDDLTLDWDWDDGAPAPDLSTRYPVPHSVAEDRSHRFGDACLYRVSLTATDDDGATGRDVVSVLVPGSPRNRARLDGYWQHQLGRQGRTEFSDAELLCLLRIAEHVSRVFSEARDAATLTAAYDVLFLKQNGGSEAELLDRDLLVAWLNFANGAFALDDPVRGGTFGEVMAAVEAIRLDPAATARSLRKARQMIPGGDDR